MVESLQTSSKSTHWSNIPHMRPKPCNVCLRWPTIWRDLSHLAEARRNLVETHSLRTPSVGFLANIRVGRTDSAFRQAPRLERPHPSILNGSGFRAGGTAPTQGVVWVAVLNVRFGGDLLPLGWLQFGLCRATFRRNRPKLGRTRSISTDAQANLDRRRPNV